MTDIATMALNIGLSMMFIVAALVFGYTAVDNVLNPGYDDEIDQNKKENDQ